MKSVIAWELRQRKMAIIWWTIGVCLLMTLLFLLYPSIHQQATALNDTINKVPAGIRGLKAGGSSGGPIDIGSTVGFLNSQVYYITLPILYIILAITRGASLLGKEEADHSLELILSRPISRGRLLLAKAVSGLLELLIIGGCASLVSLGLAHAVHMDISTSHLTLMNVYALIFSASFGAISFALVALGRLTKRLATMVAVLLSFGGWIVTSLQGASHYLTTPARFTPYHYYLPQDIMQGRVTRGLIMYIGVTFMAAALVAYFGFRRRDIA